MHNIYISKSKQGDMDDLLTLRSALSKLNASVFEYKGGEYDNRMLSEAELVIVMPMSVSKMGNSRTMLGRGQYNEVIYAMDHGIPIYLVKQLDIDHVALVEPKGIHELSYQHDWSSWGYIEYEMSSIFNIEKIIVTKKRKKLNDHNNRLKPMLACINLFK